MSVSVWFIAVRLVLLRIVISTWEWVFLWIATSSHSIPNFYRRSLFTLFISISLESEKKNPFLSSVLFLSCMLLSKYLSNARNLFHIRVDSNSHTHTLYPNTSFRSILSKFPPSSIVNVKEWIFFRIFCRCSIVFSDTSLNQIRTYTHSLTHSLDNFTIKADYDIKTLPWNMLFTSDWS